MRTLSVLLMACACAALEARVARGPELQPDEGGAHDGLGMREEEPATTLPPPVLSTAPPTDATTTAEPDSAVTTTGPPEEEPAFSAVDLARPEFSFMELEVLEPNTIVPPGWALVPEAQEGALPQKPTAPVPTEPPQSSVLELPAQEQLPPNLKEYEKFASESLARDFDAFEGVYTTPKPMLELHRPSGSPDDRIARIRAMVGNMEELPVESSFAELNPADVSSQRRLDLALTPGDDAQLQSLGEVAAYTAATTEQAAKVEAQLAASGGQNATSAQLASQAAEHATQAKGQALAKAESGLATDLGMLGRVLGAFGSSVPLNEAMLQAPMTGVF